MKRLLLLILFLFLMLIQLFCGEPFGRELRFWRTTASNCSVSDRHCPVLCATVPELLRNKPYQHWFFVQ